MDIGLVPKNQWIHVGMLEKTLESPLDSKEIKPFDPKWNQPWIFIGRPDAEAEAPMLWPPNTKSQLIGKDPDAGENWRPKKKGQQKKRWLDSITNSIDLNLRKLQEIVKARGSWCAEVHEVTKSCIRLESEVKSLSSFQLFATAWTVAYQASPSLGFSRQENRSGLQFPSPGDLPDPGVEPGSPTLQADALPSEPRGKL